MAKRHNRATKKWPDTSSPLKAVLFDMDGTLVQLHPEGRMKVLNETLLDFKLPYRVDMEQSDRFWFTSERYSMIDNWGIERDEFWRTFDCERLVEMQLEHTLPYEDVGQVLTFLRSLGLKLGVVSNSPHVSLGPKLDLLHPFINRQHFEVVVSCNDDVQNTKPGKDGVELALQKLGVAPHQTALVGDSLDDIGAGGAAGVPVVIVNRGQLSSIQAKHGFDPAAYSFKVVENLHQLPWALGLNLDAIPAGWAA